MKHVLIQPARFGVAVACTLALGVSAWGCAQQGSPAAETDEASATEGVISVENDTVTFGDVDHYTAEVESAAEEGTSLSFDEESNLQQEKTAGFTGGAVISNLEELSDGIDDYGEEPAPGQYATTGEPPAMADIVNKDMPASHEANHITEDQCANCHH